MADELGELRAVAREVARDAGAGWKQWAELGWLGLLVAEERGGAGADENVAAVVARELGAAARREPFVAAGVLTTALLAALPRTDAVDELLDSVLGGEVLAVAAWQPESGELPSQNGAHDLHAFHADRVPLSVTFSEQSGLTGNAHWVATADADAWLVAAATPTGGTALVRVGRDADSLTVHPVKLADGTTQARLELKGARGTVLAHNAGPALAAAIDTAALITAAELLGGIDTMLALTRDYLGARKQFGRPIGTFQVLQHRAVDMWVQQQLAEAALDGALRRVTVDSTDPDIELEIRAIAASSAKSRASSAALKVSNDAVQLHGAIGFTDEYELGAFVNRAFVLAASLGNSRAHVRRHGRLVA
ncbi:MAG TPA: acyl-CoA dehydrogenase family protein [Pseudonocardia sp.]|jgi:alkylation response protein AidB-like acyl-CoA dehydrogenase|nr:acyl-CoA dehydrogenase family protein [Pseudonocardia sp.]